VSSCRLHKAANGDTIGAVLCVPTRNSISLNSDPVMGLRTAWCSIEEK
jgi:hypothetical protein